MTIYIWTIPRLFYERIYGHIYGHLCEHLYEHLHKHFYERLQSSRALAPKAPHRSSRFSNGAYVCKDGRKGICEAVLDGVREDVRNCVRKDLCIGGHKCLYICTYLQLFPPSEISIWIRYISQKRICKVPRQNINIQI